MKFQWKLRSHDCYACCCSCWKEINHFQSCSSCFRWRRQTKQTEVWLNRWLVFLHSLAHSALGTQSMQTKRSCNCGASVRKITPQPQVALAPHALTVLWALSGGGLPSPNAIGTNCYNCADQFFVVSLISLHCSEC